MVWERGDAVRDTCSPWLGAYCLRSREFEGRRSRGHLQHTADRARRPPNAGQCWQPGKLALPISTRTYVCGKGTGSAIGCMVCGSVKLNGNDPVFLN